MKYALGPAVFQVSDSFRDDTSYVYMSPDQSALLRLARVAEAEDAEALLLSSQRAFDNFYGSLVVYASRLTLRRADGVSAPAVEGEFQRPSDGSPTRFALVALVQGRLQFSMLYMAARTAFIPALRALVGTIRFTAEPAPAHPTSPGHTRHRAQSLSLALPVDWSSPRTLLFAHTDCDDVTLRVTLDAPPAPEGYVSFSDDIPAMLGDRVRIVAEAASATRPPVRGWSGTWTVEHSSALGVRLVRLRKASLTYAAPETLTIYGQESARHRLLDTEWDRMMASLTQGWIDRG